MGYDKLPDTVEGWVEKLKQRLCLELNQKEIGPNMMELVKVQAEVLHDYNQNLNGVMDGYVAGTGKLTDQITISGTISGTVLVNDLDKLGKKNEES